MAFDPNLKEYCVQATHQIEAKEAYITAVLAEAAVKFGIHDGKLDQKRLKERADEIVIYVEGELLRQDPEWPNPFEFNVNVDGMNAYDHYRFFAEKMQFDAQTFRDALHTYGLSGAAIANQVVPTLYRQERALHERALTSDFDPLNLDPVAAYLQDGHNVDFGDRLKSDPDRLRRLLDLDRQNALTKRLLEESADITPR